MAVDNGTGYDPAMPRIAALLALSLLVGCSDSGAQKVAVEYQRLMLRDADAKAYELMTAEDQAVMSLEEYVGKPSDWIFDDLFLDRIAIEATGTVSTGGFVAVTLKATAPDSLALSRTTRDGGLSAVAEAGQVPALEKALIEKLAGNIPVESTELRVRTRKEPEGWRVFADLAREKVRRRARAKDAEAWDIEKETFKLGSSAEKAKALRRAISLYEEADEIYAGTSHRLPEVRKDLVSAEAEIAYLPKVKVREVTVGKSVTDQLGVWGDVKNLGDRTLKRVGVTVYGVRSGQGRRSGVRQVVPPGARGLRQIRQRQRAAKTWLQPLVWRSHGRRPARVDPKGSHRSDVGGICGSVLRVDLNPVVRG